MPHYRLQEEDFMQSIFLLVILIILNATFASAEIAVISMNETKLRMLAESGDKRAGKLASLTEQPARFLATIQVAITLAGLLQSAFAAENFAGPLVKFLLDVGVPVPESVLKSVSIVLITLILAYFNLVFGELVPKRIAMKKSESLALGMAGMLYFVSKVFAPLVWLLTVSTNLMLRLLGMNPEEEEEAVSEEEIRMLLSEGEEKGTIPAEENELIQNVFEFDDVAVGKICTYRRDVIRLPQMDQWQEWERILESSTHSYYPICGKDSEDIVGILDARAYLRLREKSKETIQKQAVEKVMFVPQTIKANDLFEQMKQERNYFAVVLDEYGGMFGIVTLHDVMELLVGELEETVAVG